MGWDVLICHVATYRSRLLIICFQLEVVVSKSQHYYKLKGIGLTVVNLNRFDVLLRRLIRQYHVMQAALKEERLQKQQLQEREI